MALQPGSRLGQYEVLSALGAGGMGEVWRARDSRLDRDVALKVLPDAFVADPERLARFQREAKVLASLNHPAIGGIYGLEEADGVKALVLELVEGPTLADCIARGPMAPAEAIPLFLRIAEGLEAAHEKGIIHRDLKPANIKVAKEGKASAGPVKILDFGLAKAMDADLEASESAISQSPTLTLAATQRGVILGTAAYMAPEQAAGKTVDERADIWAFGVCLYEALTGKRTFAGETAPETLARVLEREPDWDALPKTLPPAVERLLRRCLRKDRRERLRHIGDARLELAEAGSQAGATAAVPVSTPPRTRAPARTRALLALGLIGALALAFALGRGWSRSAEPPAAAPPLLRRTTVDLPENALLPFGSAAPAIGFDSPALALSPDGRRLVYVGRAQDETALYVREIDSFEVRRLPGTEEARFPFFSPDGGWVGFLTDDKVKKVSLRGDSAVALCDVRLPVRASWTADDVIYFGEDAGWSLSRVAARGGKPSPVPIGLPSRFSPARSTSFSDVLPGGRWALVTVWERSMSGDYAKVVAVHLETDEARTVIQLGYDARYVVSGHLVFLRGAALLAVPFDVKTMEVQGEPTSVVSGVSSDSIWGQGQFDVSRSGTLAYVPGADSAVGTLTWIDRQGGIEPLPVPPQIFGVSKISPDGRRLAVEVADLEDHVRIFDLQDPSEGRRFATGGQPVWSNDGHALTFSFIDGADRWAVARQPTDRSREPEVLLTAPDWLTPHSWSRDEAILGMTEYRADSAFNIGFLYYQDEQRYESAKEPGAMMPSFSPDGSFVAYSGPTIGPHYEIWARSADGSTKRQISTAGGVEPIWTENGALFWRNGNRFWSTTVVTRPDLAWDPPKVVFETDFVDTLGTSYDVSPDGKRLLVVKEATEREVRKILLVENWLTELERLVPVD